MNASTTAISMRSLPPPRSRPRAPARALALAALAALTLTACVYDTSGDREHGDRGRPGDGRADQERPDRERAGERPDRERTDRERPDRGAPDRERADGDVEAPPAPVLPQFNLLVAEIQVVPAYAGAPAETGVPFAPKAALELWAKTHVRAVGQQGQARIVIRDASISARKLTPQARDFRGWFRRQPVERYEAVLELELQIRDDAGRVRAQTVARATHARDLMDDHRDYQRERATQLQALTDEIIAAALKRLDGEVRTNLAQWVR
jgi:hypothetical protein